MTQARVAESVQPVRFLDVATFARLSGYKAATVRNWIRLGKIPVTRSPTGRYKISSAVLDEIKSSSSSFL